MPNLLELFDTLCDLPEDQRNARLDALALTEPALADHLRAMLAADATRHVLLDRELSQQRCLDSATPMQNRAGMQFGTYRLLQALGEGGMGTVWLAERSLGDSTQRVAIKFMRQRFDAVSAKFFAAEREALARLEHPHIARLIDAGLTPDGEPYLVTEYVDGESLNDYVARMAPSLTQRLALIETLCAAVDYAHRRLLVHRDIKPSNILIDRDGRPRLVDFGIAKSLDTAGGDTEQPFSPAYSSPEQAVGEPVSTATDVFALGLLLYELLTGTLPGQRRSSSGAALMHSLHDEKIVAPSLNSRSAPGIPQKSLKGDLDLIVLTALKREPDRRYPSALALAEDLQRWRGKLPIRARRDSFRYRASKFVSRHRGAVGFAALSLVGILAALGLALWQAERARANAELARIEAERANAQTQVALESAQRTDRVKVFLMDIFTSTDPLRSGKGELTLAAAFDQALASIDTKLAGDPKLQIDLWDDFGEIRSHRGEFDAAKALFERALKQAELTYGPEHSTVAESLLNLAAVESYRGGKLSAELVERALGIARQYPNERERLANALNTMLVLRAEEGRFEEALALGQEALAVITADGRQDMTVAPVMHGVGVQLLNAARYEEAETHLRGALAIVEREASDDSTAQLVIMSALADALEARSKWDEAGQMMRRAVVVAERAFPAAHSWTASAITDLGWHDVEHGKIEAGIAELERALAMYLELESDNGEITPVLRYLGLAQVRAGDLKAARGHFDDALARCEGTPDPRCHLVRANRAAILPRLGEAPLALAEAQRAIDDMATVGWVDTREHAQGLKARANALQALGRHDEARTDLQHVVAILTKLYGAEHPETKKAQVALDALGAAASL
jgi:serine/threonine-protein kinase